MQFKLSEVLRRMNLLLFDDIRYKYNFMREFLDEEIELAYIDIDLLISGYIKSGLIKPRAYLELYMPEDLDELAADIAEVSSIRDEHIVVIDSFDTLEELYNAHLVSIYLSLLLYAKNLKVILISKRRRWFLEHLSEVVLYIDDNIHIIKHSG